MSNVLGFHNLNSITSISLGAGWTDDTFQSIKYTPYAIINVYCVSIANRDFAQPTSRKPVGVFSPRTVRG